MTPKRIQQTRCIFCINPKIHSRVPPEDASSCRQVKKVFTKGSHLFKLPAKRSCFLVPCAGECSCSRARGLGGWSNFLVLTGSLPVLALVSKEIVDSTAAADQAMRTMVYQHLRRGTVAEEAQRAR